MCSPPQREADDQTALWDGLRDGTLDLVSSDHAPYRFDHTGKLASGPTPTFADIANGLPGLEVRLPLMFDSFLRGMMSGIEFVRLTATRPAEIYGLQGKGDIRPGHDADLVIWDTATTRTYGDDDLHDNVGYNPWAGRAIKGMPTEVYLRGNRIVSDGRFSGGPGQGKWLPRPAIGVRAACRPASEYDAATR
jgi:dihydropyrimidinase